MTSDITSTDAAAAPAPEDQVGAPSSILPMPDEARSAWKRRIAASEQAIEERRVEWKDAVQSTMGKVLDKEPEEHTSVVPLEFSYAELKKAQLAFQVPEVNLRAKNPQWEATVPVIQAVSNFELGDDNACVSDMFEECLSDALTCGIAFSKIGYEATKRTRQKPRMQPVLDPATQQPVAGPDGKPLQQQALGPDKQPIFDPEEYIADESYYWNRFEPEHGLVPAEFKRSNFDRASWVGMIFHDDLACLKRRYKLPDSFSGGGSGNDQETLAGEQRDASDQTGNKPVKGWEIWYMTAVFDPEANALPKQVRQLVFLEGHSEPVVHQDSPYQWFDDQTGKLMGMEGFPIHVLTLRFTPGTAYPTSDVGISLPLVDELTVGRSQMMRFRDRVMPLRAYNKDLMDPDTLTKIEEGKTGDWIGVNGEVSRILGIIAPAQFPRENFTFDEVIKRDFEQAWSLGRNGGLQLDTKNQTATEANIAQSASDVRLDKERTRVLRFFTRGAMKFVSLLQAFKDDESFAPLVGEDGVKRLQPWNRHDIQGEYIFSAKPDSALRIDADVERRQALGLYNQLGKDPNVRRTELLKSVLQRFGYDPSKIVVDTPPAPAPKPEPPKISFSLKPEDLDPLHPGFALTIAILQQAGIQLPQPQPSAGLPGQPMPPGVPQAAMPPTPHPGAMPTMEPINKHALDRDLGRVAPPGAH
jgi:hypothetical protein